MRHTLKKSRSDLQPRVAVIVDGASNFGRTILSGVQKHVNLQRRWDMEIALRPTAETQGWQGCDGVIIAGTERLLTLEILDKVKNLVYCSGGGDAKRSAVVSIQDESAAAMAAEHLIDCRLKHFAFFGEPVPMGFQTRRLIGFRRVLESRGFQCHVSPVGMPALQLHADYFDRSDLMKWLNELPKPIGILAADDLFAYELARSCRMGNIGVPERIAIIGINNDALLCEGAWPPMSSIECDFSRVGYEAARLMDRMLAGERLTLQEREIRLPPIGVVQRQSTNIHAIQDPHVADALRYIREHACDPCSVHDVLKVVPVGRRWLERQFMLQIGRTPHEEITRIRIDAAKRLLQQPDLLVEEIALRCGFSHSKNFYVAFHDSTGRAPIAYRRSVLPGDR